LPAHLLQDPKSLAQYGYDIPVAWSNDAVERALAARIPQILRMHGREDLE